MNTAIRIFTAAPSNIGCKHQVSRTTLVRRELDDICVRYPGEATRGSREIGGVGLTNDEYVTITVNGDATGIVSTKATKVGGIVENRVDHQLSTGIVVAQSETDTAILVDDVGAFNLDTRAVIGGLETDWRFEKDLVALLVQDQAQSTVLGDLGAQRAIEIEVYLVRVAAGTDNKVVFELTLVAVVTQVDAVVNILVVNASIIVDIGLPVRFVIAEQVVAAARQRVLPNNIEILVGTKQIESDRLLGITAAQHQHRVTIG